jgi:predicted amidohydrolase YtcJ
VVLDANGQPTGEINAPATTLRNQAIIAQLDSFTLEQRVGCLARFMREVNRRGMTAWKDAGGNKDPMRWRNGCVQQ